MHCDYSGRGERENSRDVAAEREKNLKNSIAQSRGKPTKEKENYRIISDPTCFCEWVGNFTNIFGVKISTIQLFWIHTR